jgi:hypothetical protein
MGHTIFQMTKAAQRLFKRGLTAVGMTVLVPVMTQAADFNIDNGNVGSLVDAINTANNDKTTADTINLAALGTYTLTAVNNANNGLPIITSEITINGNGATIERSSATGTPDFRILSLGTTAGLTLKGVTIKGGRLQSLVGGGIHSNAGKLNVIDSVVTGNRGLHGGGIYNGGGIVELTNSTVSANIATSWGGGIWNDGIATLTLTDSRIVGNRASWRGAGINNFSGTVTLVRSTVSDNTGFAGGTGAVGIFSFLAGSKLTLINSTVSGNGGWYGLGGVFNAYGAAELFSSTVSGNNGFLGSGGGVINLSGTLSLKNTIVANNIAANGQPTDCAVGYSSDVITSHGYNLFGVNAGCSSFSVSTDITSPNPGLDTLALNPPGKTETHALQPGSPAKDAVPLNACTAADNQPVTTDQRGVARPQGAACDIGAFEFMALNRPPLANAGPDQTVEATSPTGAFATLNGSGSSDPDGDVLTYNWAGPFAAVGGVNPTVALPLGTHTLTLTVSDGKAAATDTVSIKVQDTTPPDTSINSAVDGHGVAVASGGSTLSTSITFTFGGSDTVGVAGFQCKLDGAAYASCTSPVAYSALAIGSHTIQARALDTAGNIDATPASFTWVVITPAQAVQNLTTAIANMGLPAGVANSLSAPLGQASTLLNDGNPSNDNAVCGKLDAFTNQVSTKLGNGQLTSAQAAQLLQAANAVKASLGC